MQPWKPWPKQVPGNLSWLRNHAKMLRRMLVRAEAALAVAEHAVGAATSAVEAASAERTLAGARQELAKQREKQHDLDNHGIARMDTGVSPHELDAQARAWNRAWRPEPEGQDWYTAYVGAYVDEPVAAYTNAPSDDVPPEPNVAADRVVVPASGSAFVAPASGSAAASSGYGPHAPDAAGDVASWHYGCYGAEVARAIEATADAEAIAARPPPAVHIPRTLPAPPPFLERSRRGDARARASSAGGPSLRHSEAAGSAVAVPLPPARECPIYMLRGRHEASPELDVDWTLSEDWAEEQRLMGGAERADQDAAAGGNRRVLQKLGLVSVSTGPFERPDHIRARHLRRYGAGG